MFPLADPLRTDRHTPMVSLQSESVQLFACECLDVAFFL